MIKLITIDLDGTLFDDVKKISDENKIAISKCHSLGIKIVIATGRPIKGVMPVLEELGLTTNDDYVIIYNGAKILNVGTMNVISSTYIKDISMEGDIVTVVRGDGTHYSFDINDNDTTYPSASEEEEGVSKLYSSLGENEDGGVSQKVVTDTFYQINRTIDDKQLKASYDEETKQISLYY